MNSNDDTTEHISADRPLGYWLRVVGTLLGREMVHGGDRDDIRSRVEAAVSPEDYATTVASLEAIAREFGWDAERAERFDERGPRRGFGPGFGFGPHHGLHGDHGHGHHGHGHHGRGHHGRGGRRRSEHAYERGFDAGFQRGREATASAPAA